MVSPQGGWRRDRGRARWPGNSNCGQILHGIPSAAAGGAASGLLQSNCRWGLNRVHNCTIFLYSLDVGNLDDQCRGLIIKEKHHLAGQLTSLNGHV